MTEKFSAETKEAIHNAINNDTDVVDAGVPGGIVYAETRIHSPVGLWVIEYEKAREDREYLPDRPERFRVRGPLIEDDDGSRDGTAVTPGDEKISEVLTALEQVGWDYVEKTGRQ